MSELVITEAKNDVLVGSDGTHYIDLFSAFGATFLGHVNPQVTAVVRRQLDKLWMIGAISTPIREEAARLVNGFFPDTHQLAGLYSTGMEAAEFAIRHARVTTGRNGFVGFDRGMHGKSMATAFLGWNNRDGVELPQFHRLPFLPAMSEVDILSQLHDRLAGREVAAVFVEPLQGSGGGYQASDEFYHRVEACCRETGTLLVFDEILTGFYRTGVSFFHIGAGLCPDTILIGKALGNGFPVAGVVTRTAHPVVPQMLPSSTFSGNPLAAAAVVGTLTELNRLPIESFVADIHQQIRSSLQSLSGDGVAIRGCGACWVVEFPESVDGRQLVSAIYRRGVAVGFGGGFMRLMPPATVDPENLKSACSTVVDEVNRALSLQP
ncbi:MAG: aminotransferase class III-fold pyridoxal phosphate-dependent enzyme [Fuerstiella sp.]